MFRAIVSILSVVSLVGCYASGKPPEDAKAAFGNVEHGTGKVLEGTGNLINAGVHSADKSWQTEEERKKGEQ